MAEQGRFKKSLNLVDVTFLGLGSVIGSGWLFGAMKATQYAGNLAWLAWLFGGVATLLIALTYAGLAAAMPRGRAFCFILGMSYIGSFGPKNSSPIIGKPWDTAIVGVCALAFYFWGLASALSEPQIDSDEEDTP